MQMNVKDASYLVTNSNCGFKSKEE